MNIIFVIQLLMDNLPNEILLHIYNYIPLESAIVLRKTNKQHNEIFKYMYDFNALMGAKTDILVIMLKKNLNCECISLIEEFIQQCKQFIINKSQYNITYKYKQINIEIIIKFGNKNAIRVYLKRCTIIVNNIYGVDSKYYIIIPILKEYISDAEEFIEICKKYSHKYRLIRKLYPTF